LIFFVKLQVTGLYNVCGGLAAVIRQDPKSEAFVGSSSAACESEATAKPHRYLFPIKLCFFI